MHAWSDVCQFFDWILLLLIITSSSWYIHTYIHCMPVLYCTVLYCTVRGYLSAATPVSASVQHVWSGSGALADPGRCLPERNMAGRVGPT